MLENIIVLGGGWSVSQYNLRDLEHRGFLIGVNDSAVFSKCAAAVSMDRLWSENRYAMLHTQGVPEIHIRQGVVKAFVLPKQVYQFACDEESVEMSAEKGRLNGTNSGTVALNLAYQKIPPRVFLLGFDMCRGPNNEKHWYPDYPWKYDTKPSWYIDWAKEFDSISQQFQKIGIEVFNVNHRSAIEAFRKITFTEFVRMTDK